jgi:hypothetical protein
MEGRQRQKLCSYLRVLLPEKALVKAVVGEIGLPHIPVSIFVHHYLLFEQEEDPPASGG